jgi:hypothetical protein
MILTLLWWGYKLKLKSDSELLTLGASQRQRISLKLLILLCSAMRGNMRSIEQLTEELLALPNESRALLADKLVESLEFDTDSAIQAVWVTEAKRRRDEVRNGSIQPIPGEDALAQVRQLIEP